MSTTTTAARARTVTWQAGNIRLKRDDSPWNLYNLLDGVSAKTPIDRTYLVEPVDASFASGSLTLTAHRVRITVGDDAEQWTVHREQKLRTLVLDAPVILLNPPTEDAVDAADFARHVKAFRHTVLQVVARGRTPLALPEVYHP